MLHRFADKYIVNGTEYRTLIKAFGLRFIITVNGNAGKFSILPVSICLSLLIYLFLKFIY